MLRISYKIKLSSSKLSHINYLGKNGCLIINILK